MIEHQLERALRRYVANRQSGTALAAVALAEGHTSEVQDDAERIVFDCGDRGGPLLDQGNYELPVEIVVITSGHKRTDTDDPIARHAARVEELTGLFSQERMGAVLTALELLDDILGVSGYWPIPHQFGRKDGNFVTSLPFVFHVHYSDNAGHLAVTPGTGLVAIGPAAGPFTPGSIEYTLTNTGTAALSWVATSDSLWITLSAGSGTLAVSASTTVTATVNAAAEDLAEGAWFDLVTFTNPERRVQTTTRAIGLLIGADTVTRKTGSQTIDNGASTFEIEFDEPFDDVPAFADVNIIPAAGQPAIAVRNLTRAADKLTVELDTAVPTAGYVANWFALLE